MGRPDPSNYTFSRFSRSSILTHSNDLLAVLDTVGVGVASLSSGRHRVSRGGRGGSSGGGDGGSSGSGGSRSRTGSRAGTVVVVDVEDAAGGFGRRGGGAGRSDGGAVGVKTGGLDGGSGDVSDTRVRALCDFFGVDVWG